MSKEKLDTGFTMKPICIQNMNLLNHDINTFQTFAETNVVYVSACKKNEIRAVFEHQVWVKY